MSTSNEHYTSEQFRAEVIKAIAAAFAKSPLKDFQPSVLSPEERLLDIVSSPEGWRVQVASDGLNLEQKTLLEKEVQAAIEPQKVKKDDRLTIYFKRKQPLLKNPPPPPGASPEQALPYGLRRNRRAIPGVRDIILVASGKGGVGKSTVSVNLAVALAQSGKKVGLLDADIYGPSAPIMLGAEGPMGVAPGNRIIPIEAYNLKVVSFGFLSDIYSPVISRGPMISKGLKQLCYDTAWDDLDYLVIDLPPGTGDVQLTIIEELPVTSAIIVTTPQNVALLDAHKALTMFEKLRVPVLGLVENMAYHTCSQCGHEEAIFGRETDAFVQERSTPLLARIPLQAVVRENGDKGKPIAASADSPTATPFYELARRLIKVTSLAH